MAPRWVRALVNPTLLSSVLNNWNTELAANAAPLFQVVFKRKQTLRHQILLQQLLPCLKLATLFPKAFVSHPISNLQRHFFFFFCFAGTQLHTGAVHTKPWALKCREL